MDSSAIVALYLARRNSYADFLTAADAESSVIWYRSDGRYKNTDGTPDTAAAVAAVDEAYTATRVAYNVIDVEGIGPVKEGRAVVEALAAMHKTPEDPSWYDFKKAREAFTAAATAHLKSLLPEG